MIYLVVSEDNLKPYEAIPHTNTEINAYFHHAPIVKKIIHTSKSLCSQ